MSYSKYKKYFLIIANYNHDESSLGILFVGNLNCLEKQAISEDGFFFILDWLFFVVPLVSKLRNKEIFKPWNVCHSYLVYQSNEATLKPLTEWSKDELHLTTLAARKLCGSSFIKLSPCFMKKKSYITSLLPKKNKIKSTPLHAVSTWNTRRSGGRPSVSPDICAFRPYQ